MAAWKNIWEHLLPSGFFYCSFRRCFSGISVSVGCSFYWVARKTPERLKGFSPQTSVFYVACGGLYVVGDLAAQAWVMPDLYWVRRTPPSICIETFDKDRNAAAVKIHTAVRRVQIMKVIFLLKSLCRQRCRQRCSQPIAWTPPLAPCTTVPTEECLRALTRTSSPQHLLCFCVNRAASDI